jgi:arabinose-5-phosphate isomerase
MSDAIDLMTQNRIATLLVVEDERPAAIVHIAELMQAGYVG